MDRLPHGQYMLAGGAILNVPYQAPFEPYPTLGQSRPTIWYLSKDEVVAVHNSREDIIKWCKSMRGISPFNRIVDQRATLGVNGEQQMNACILRVVDLKKDEKIQDLFAQMKLVCRGVPDNIFSEEKVAVENSKPVVKAIEIDIKEYVLSDLSRIYFIGSLEIKIISLFKDSNYGFLFLANDIKSEKMIIIKVLKEKADQEHLEYEKMAKFGQHPNVVQYYGYKDIQGKIWIAMEYLEGMTMSEFERYNKWTSELAKQYQEANEYITKVGLRSQRENPMGNTIIAKVNGVDTVKLIDFGTTAYA